MVAEREQVVTRYPLCSKFERRRGWWQREGMVVTEREAAGGDKIPPPLAIRATERVGGRGQREAAGGARKINFFRADLLNLKAKKKQLVHYR